MKILQVITSLDPKGGGPAETARSLGLVLREMGHETAVATLDSPESAWLKDMPCETAALGPAYSHYRYSPRLVPWLREHAKEYDAVVVRGLWQYTGFGTRLALQGSGTPYFVYPHGMLDPWFKRAHPIKHIKKWMYWPWGEYRVLRDARAVLFTCEQERLLARGSFWLYRCRERTVGYGIIAPPGDRKDKIEAFFRQFPALRGRRIMIFLGRIHHKKGCGLLIKAFARSAGGEASLRLVMAGPDQEGWKASLLRLSENLGVADKITWTGMISGEIKWGALYASDAFILPSHQENFGIAAVEALSCGTPVLISDKVNIWREIDSDGAGLVADDSLDGTAGLLERWLSLPDSEKDSMRDSARRSFLKRFEIHNAAQNLIGVLSEKDGLR